MSKTPDQPAPSLNQQAIDSLRAAVAHRIVPLLRNPVKLEMPGFKIDRDNNSELKWSVFKAIGDKDQWVALYPNRVTVDELCELADAIPKLEAAVEFEIKRLNDRIRAAIHRLTVKGPSDV